jgi:prepilin-type N-terminal cleavage/methylation domain-containing protein
MRNNKGFTLTELIIVLIIIAILTAVAIPIYTKYNRRAMTVEAKSLLATINTSQRAYYANYNGFLDIYGTVDYSPELSVDARENKYFTSFSCSVTNFSKGKQAYSAEVTGTGAAEGITLTMDASVEGPLTIEEEGV